MFKFALLLLVASAVATETGDDCFEDDVVEKGQVDWNLSPGLDAFEKKITIGTTVKAAVFTRIDSTVDKPMIETKFFPKEGMTIDISSLDTAYSVSVNEKVMPEPDVNPNEDAWKDEEDPNADASGSMSLRGNAVAWMAASVVAVFSVFTSPSKYSLTVLLVIALAMSATGVESAGETDCANVITESHVVLVVVFKSAAQQDEYKLVLDIKEGSPASVVDSELCTCAVNDVKKMCVYNLMGKFSCDVPKGAATTGVVDFRWLDDDCKEEGEQYSTTAKASAGLGGVVIFSHGWQDGSGKGRSDPCWFGGTKGGVGRNDDTEIVAFTEANWKVGAVHWERFADEGEVKDAEAKIWSSSSKQRMRYVTDASRKTYVETDNAPVADQLYAIVAPVIKDAVNAGVRMVFGGHSLGSQVITRMAYLFTVDSNMNPPLSAQFDLWLLDAFFSKGDKDYHGGRTPGENMLMYVQWLQTNTNMRIHRTKTSSLSGGISGEAMGALDDRVMFSTHKPGMFGWFGFAEKHNSAYVYWLRSIKGWGSQPAPPDILSLEAKNGCKWNQKGGTGTIKTEDDSFSEKC